MKKWVGNSLLVCASLAVALLLAMAADWVVGRLEKDPHLKAGLLFSPNVSALYETYEFSYVTEINNLGIRDYDTTLKKQHAIRVVAIGDSYTFGWGVPIEETWVKLLEENLRARGHDVEVLNLGCPGFGPHLYARTAEEAVPLLKPDLILLDILPGDDLRQSQMQVDLEDGLNMKDRDVMRNSLRRLFPNFTAWALKKRQEREAYLTERGRGAWQMFNIGVTWKATSQNVLSSMTDAEIEIFGTMDREIQQAFREGKINPFLLETALGRGTLSPADSKLDLGSDEMRDRLLSMEKPLARVKAVAAAEGANLVALLLPEASYVSPEVWRVSRDFWHHAREDDLTTQIHEKAAQEALHRAGIESVSVIAKFRELARDASLYYPIDAHMNAAGNRAFADLVTPIIEEKIITLQHSPGDGD